MNKNSSPLTFLFFISFLILLNLYQVYSVWKAKQSIHSLQEQLQKYQFDKDGDTYLLENRTVISKLQHYAEGKIFPNYDLSINNGSKICLKDLAAGKNKLVYYISERGCAMCYTQFLHKLSSLIENIGKDKIIVLAMFNETRTLKAFLQSEQIKIDLYHITEEPIIFPENNEYPLAFMLTDEMRIENVHITDKSNQELSDDYLSIIKIRLTEH